MHTDNETSLKKTTQLLRRGILKKGLHRFSLEGSSESPAHAAVVEKRKQKMIHAAPFCAILYAATVCKSFKFTQASYQAKR